MVKRRNSLGRFIPDNKDYITIKIPGPIKILKILLIIIVLSPWIFVIFFRIDVKDIFRNLMETLFVKENEQTKKNNGFF